VYSVGHEFKCALKSVPKYAGLSMCMLFVRNKEIKFSRKCSVWEKNPRCYANKMKVASQYTGNKPYIFIFKKGETLYCLKFRLFFILKDFLIKID